MAASKLETQICRCESQFNAIPREDPYKKKKVGILFLLPLNLFRSSADRLVSIHTEDN